jgi:N utilization substance protein A
MENLKQVLSQIEKEKGISSEEVIQMLESALMSAFKKHAVDKSLEYTAKVDPQTGQIKVFVEKEVVNRVKDPVKEIDKVSAMLTEPSIQVGAKVNVEVPADQFGRIAAQTAKQIILQKIRENERENIYKEFKTKEGEIVTGTVYRFLDGGCIIEMGKVEAILPERERIKKERLSRGDSLKFYVIEVEKSGRGPRIIVSRTHPGLVAGLFKLEVPEVSEKVVQIVKIVRDPGVRCKVAVFSNNLRVDPIGACVGINGVRVQSVINELGGERMDLIKYSEDIKEYLANSLSPAKTSKVIILDQEKKESRIVVSDEMLSLAIGKNGQNVRLAARLTDWHIDIQSESQMKELIKSEVLKTDMDMNITNIPGVGEKTAKLLAGAGYDTAQKIKDAGLEGLTSVKGIGKKTAEKIIKEIAVSKENK